MAAEGRWRYRLTPESSEVNTISSPSTKTLDRDYEYTADGRLSFVNDALGGSSERFDRLFTYDHAGRVKDAKTGIEAQGQTQSNLQLLPYRQNYTFNAFGNITARTSTLWDYDGNWNFTYNVTNNRASGSLYDHDGRETRDSILIHFQYDASGSMRKTWRNYSTYTVYETLLDHDGHGRESKRSQRTWDPDLSQWEAWETTYFIASSVLGRIVTEVGDTGKKKRTYVIAAGSVLAKQAVDSSGQEGIGWKYSDASGLSTRSSSTGTYVQTFEAEERDALGNNVGTFAVPTPPDRPGNSASSGTGFTFASTDWSDCELDGIMTPCSMVDRAMGMGAVKAQALFFSEERGLRYHSFDPDELPGRRFMFFIPDQVTTTRTDNGTVGGTVDDRVGNSTQETVYLGGQGQWLTVGGISLFGDRTPCADMARRAQEIADRKIREAGTDLMMGPRLNIERAWDNVLKAFDAEFTPEYIGTTVNSLQAVHYLVIQTTGGAKSGPLSQYGQHDFKEKYLDQKHKRNDPSLDADQVHHFAAYLSMGIHKFSLVATGHTLQDAWNRNFGDVALSTDAYAFAHDLKRQPRGLRTIGRSIYSQFCTPVSRSGGARAIG